MNEKIFKRFSAFTLLIANINRCIRRIKIEEMAEFNLKSLHVSCLYYLYHSKSLTASELVDICGEDKAAISRSIEYLESVGYVACSSPAKKRYKSPLALTESGMAVAQTIVDKVDGVLLLASEGMDEGERDVMYRCLALINENLQTVCDGYDK